jgi:general secretion pathway protein D
MKRVENYLKRLQAKVQLQVLIDVQLLSVNMTNSKTTGIDWKQLYALQSISLTLNSSSNTNPKNIFTMNAGGSLNEVIKFLKTQGDVHSISNPKILTLNNQPALITAGTEYFYKLSSTQTLAGNGSGTQNQSEDIQSVFAGVLLSITPEISKDNTITLIINPSLSETTEDLSAVQTTDRRMPPDLTRRQLSSVVTVKDGNRIVLGGLINTRNVHSESKIPILGDIPLLNYLFKYESNTKQVQELVIIIQPHIVDKSKRGLSLSDLGFSELSESNSTKVKK